MKPNFALTLSSERIGLLHRTSRGWLPVGEVATDSPDLAAQLSWLRSTALELSPQGITTKLVLPTDQILFTEILAPGPDASQRRRQIRRALEGRTPYKLDELVFDWWGTGDRVQVAVVAKETLEEAETFAVEHRFNPVSFVAIPPTPAFAGEPFFGTTKVAKEIVGPGESVGRDQDPVRIIARETAAEAAPTPASAREHARPGEDRDAAPAPDVAGEQPASPGAAAPEQPARPSRGASPPAEPVSAADAPAAEPQAAPAAAAEPGPDAGGSLQDPAPGAAVAPAGSEAADAPAPGPAPGPAPEPGPQADARPPASSPAPTAAEPAPAAAARPAAAQSLAREEAHAAGEPPSAIVSAIAAIRARSASERAGPGAGTGEAADGGARARPAAPPAPPPEAAGATPAPTFFSRRRDESAGQTRSSLPPVSPAKEATARPAATEVAPTRSPAAPVPPSRAGLAAVPPPVARAPGAGAATTPPPPRPLPPAGPPARGAAAKAPGPVAARLAGRPPSEAAAAASTATLPPGRAAAGVAGSLGTRTVRQRGKPRYLGLVLTGALLLFLVLVAAWSSLMLVQDDGAGEPAADPVALADAGGDAAPDAGGTEAGAVDPEYEADLAAMGEAAAPATTGVAAEDLAGTDLASLSAAQDGAADPEAEAIAAELSGEAVGPATDVTAEPHAAGDPVVAETASQPAIPPAAARPAPQVAADNGGPIAAPEEAGQDEILLSRADDAPAAVDPLVLPPPAAADLPPPMPMPPPPAGTTYAFDADGRLVAPPGGIVTPDGIWLIAARPPVVPPPRPEPPAAAGAATQTAAAAGTDGPPAGSADVAAPQTGAGAAAAETDAVAAPGFVSDPAAGALRPRARPARPAPRQAEDDAGLLPATDRRLAVLRPQARPAAILAAAAASAPATGTEGASLFAAAAASSADPMAVVWSRRPAPRPQDFQAAVEAAVAAAVRPPDPVPAPETAASSRGSPAVGLSPEELAEDDGGEEPAAAPRIPTSANVAREATFVNAINLSKINLIGIYGTPSKRTALIRLANGRYVKVGVGDRVDGGRVAAITASEVRYQKGGRLVTLAMPRG